IFTLRPEDHRAGGARAIALCASGRTGVYLSPAKLHTTAAACERDGEEAVSSRLVISHRAPACFRNCWYARQSQLPFRSTDTISRGRCSELPDGVPALSTRAGILCLSTRPRSAARNLRTCSSLRQSIHGSPGPAISSLRSWLDSLCRLWQ